MKRNIFVVAGVLAMIFVAANVGYTADGFYASLNAGMTIPNDPDFEYDGGPNVEFEAKEGFAVTYAMGGKFNDFVRAEIEIGYQENDLEKARIGGIGTIDVAADVSVLSLLVNGYYDFANPSMVTPYLTAGIGMAQIDVSDIQVAPGLSLPGDDDFVFAYQVGAGIGFQVHERVALDLRYRYFGTSEPEYEYAQAECSIHAVTAGIRVSF